MQCKSLLNKYLYTIHTYTHTHIYIYKVEYEKKKIKNYKIYQIKSQHFKNFFGNIEIKGLKNKSPSKMQLLKMATKKKVKICHNEKQSINRRLS